MARDYRPRQPKMLDSHSARQQRQEKQTSSRNLWLSMFLMIAVMLGGFWVITHFASSGVKSSAKVAESEQQILSSESDDEIEAGDEFKSSSAEPLAWLREPEQVPSKGKLANTEQSDVIEESTGIFVEALPMPEAAKLYAEPEITFYDTINDVEVIPDDTTPISVALDTPKYLLAGSFFSSSAAQRALKRLSAKGQKLFMRETWSSARNRAVYVLYTAPYTNRLELNARKNELRALGAGVMERDYKVADSKQQVE